MYKDKKITYNLVLFLLFVILAILPLIVRLNEVRLNSMFYERWLKLTIDFDFYSHAKVVTFLIITVLLIVAFIISVFKKEIKFKSTKVYFLISGYLFFVILSTLLSSDKVIALNGFWERYEGLYTLCGYIIVFLITLNIIEDERQIKFLLKGFFISTIIIGVIGFFQYLNMDIFQTKFGQDLMLPNKYNNQVGKLVFPLGKRAVYGTLYHSNYFGSFMAMVFPLTLSIFYLNKSKKVKTIMAVMSLLSITTLIMSHSRAGIYASVITFLVFVLWAGKDSIKNAKFIIYFFIAMTIIVSAVNSLSNGYILKRITNIGTVDVSNTLIEDILSNDNVVTIKTKKEILKIKLKDSRIVFMDENDNEIQRQFRVDNGNQILLSDNRYKNFILSLHLYQGMPVIEAVIYGQKVDFIIDKGEFKYLTSSGNIEPILKVKSIGFKGKESLGSARGYIWSRTLPLIKNTFIVGYGPDTFALHFPQNDFVGKLKAYGTMNIIVDKPHNFYLQTAINTGVISLILILAVFLNYIIQSIKIYFKEHNGDFYHQVGTGIFLSVTGYLIAAFFNDSVISVAPVFWILFGMGYAINYIVEKNASAADI